MLDKVYSEIKKTIVAVIAKSSRNRDFPDILGTGFFVREDGIVLTNQHVIDAIRKLPQAKPGQKLRELAMVLYFIESEKGVGLLPLEIDGATRIKYDLPFDAHYGPETPDVTAIVLKDVCNCPCLKMFDTNLSEGSEIGVAGFPMGTSALRVPGWIHQIGPTLQKGVISAVLPFPCDAPHAILIDTMIQGGSSGSPVFLTETGEVAGMVYAGLDNFYSGANANKQLVSLYKVPTSLALAVPAWFLKKAIAGLEGIEEINKIKENKVPLEDWIKSRNVDTGKPKGLSMMKPRE